ncbi:MAG: NAD(P)H-hydrate epimerase [Anaerosomatales bacterium]|nr:NAD(P)H-hydrate epimerase [Anaerosomatales bacterium]MDT8434596.1 NAD(P)H-hydrate epimerase [Anaerosomatales bacterium]
MDRLAARLSDIADAHHAAYAATDGEDPGWPRWYARQLLPSLDGTDLLPRLRADTLPWLSVDQMAEADRLAIEEFGIGLLQMMEHAGAALADLVMRLAPEGRITVLAGGGNNGGGGLAAARHLVNRGREVEVVLATERPGDAARHHLITLGRMGIAPADRPGGDVAVDALVGYGLSGRLRGRSAELAAWASAHRAISLDFPSGHGFEGAVEPMATLTLALPKKALADVRPLYLADIGLPETLWRTMGVESGDPFRPGRIVEVV